METMNQDQMMSVVLRYRNGVTERAMLRSTDEAQHKIVIDRDGAGSEVPFDQLKAVFFPRPGGADEQQEEEQPAGSTVSVEFADGEIIRGTAVLNPEKPGFILFPLDRSKNDRMFVVTSAIVSIEVEKL